ncbi:MAG TPA: toll/interleukin-1 receptor domain-containing protein, partial [Ktedonobacteraceae bacterium]
GICAGNKARVTLGDLIVAESTYLHDSGSYVFTADGGSEHQHNTRTIQVSTDILHFAQGFDDWRQEPFLQLARPRSKHQQKDWLLTTLLAKQTIPEIGEAILDKQAPRWRTLIRELQQGETPFLSSDLQLINVQKVKMLSYGLEVFPYHDPLTPTCHIGSMASGNSVRKDNPFPDISQPVSKVLGLDMECWAFYHTLQERHNIRSLFVKGVCDYADGEKDDSYHKYAATLSATYMYAFIKKFVTEERMPSPVGRQSLPTTPEPTPPALDPQPDPGTGKQPLQVFLSASLSDDDKYLINKLDRHLFTLARRYNTVKTWYRRDIPAGNARDAMVQQHIRAAQLIVLLITQEYISSDFYGNEYALIKECSDKGTTVIPILLKAVSDKWKREFYGAFQALPRDEKPVASWGDTDGIMATISEEISDVIDSLVKKA